MADDDCDSKGADRVFFDRRGGIEVVEAVVAGSGTVTAEVGFGFGFGRELFAGRRGTEVEGAAGAEVDAAAEVVAGAVAAGDDKAGLAAVIRVGAGIGIRAFFAGGGGNEVQGVFDAGGGVLALPFELFDGGFETRGNTISTSSSSSAGWSTNSASSLTFPSSSRSLPAPRSSPPPSSNSNPSPPSSSSLYGDLLKSLSDPSSSLPGLPSSSPSMTSGLTGDKGPSASSSSLLKFSTAVGEHDLAEEEDAIVRRREDVARAELVEVAREDEAADTA
jgi:hypothetical protein